MNQVGGEDGARRDDQDVGQGHHEAGPLHGLHNVAQWESQAYGAGVLFSIRVLSDRRDHPHWRPGLSELTVMIS